MNAPANIPSDALWSNAERAHRRAISIHCPNETEFGMASRAEIAAVRDQASAALRYCCDDARTILSEAARMAAIAVYAPMTPRRLTLTRSALRQVMEAARAIERANKPEKVADGNGGG